MNITVPVLRDRFVHSWPEHDDAPRVMYLTLADAFSLAWRTDAHFAAYSVPEIPHRFMTDSPERVPVRMPLFVADVDDPVAHRLKIPARPQWRATLRPKVDRLLATHPGPVFYETRGGARIVYALAVPRVIRGRADGTAWRVWYFGTIAYLLGRFGIECDPGCSDWTRLYRLPHATRDSGGSPERRPMLGDATRLGVLTTAFDPARDLEAARSLPGWQRVVIALAPTPPRTPARRIIVPPTDPHASRARYVAAALRSACEAIRDAPDGTQNDTIHDQAHAMAGFVAAGELDEHATREQLLDAALEGRHPERRARKAIDSGFRTGMQRPRHAIGGSR